MEYLNSLFELLKENNILKVVIILSLLFIFILCLNIFIDFMQSKVINKKAKSAVLFLKTPILITITIVWSLVYIKQYLVLGENYEIFSNIIRTSLFIYYLIVINKLKKVLFSPIIRKILVQKKVSKDILIIVDKMLWIFIFTIWVYIIFTLWGVNLTPLLAWAWIAWMALALAAKDSLANLFWWVSMFLDWAFKVWDYIIIDWNKRGEVIETWFRSTRIKTRDDVLVTIPNSSLANAVLVNESAPSKNHRIKISVWVSYWSDLDFVEKVLLEAVKWVDWIVIEPEKRVRVRWFWASSVDLDLLVWISDPSLRWRVKHKLFKKIYKLFDEKKIKIPFPQMDLHIENFGKKLESGKGVV